MAIAPPAGATAPAVTTYILNYEGEATCPASHLIKGMTFDASNGRVTTQCYTQFYWDANMMGGQVFMDFDTAIRAGRGFDADVIAAVTSAIADYKAERTAIDALRDDAQRRAQTAADASPGDVICKAWSYTSVYNGSGGGSVCAVNNNPIDVSVKRPVPAPAETTSPEIAASAKGDSVSSQTYFVASASAAKYFAKAAKTPKIKGTYLKFTLPKAPKGSKLSVFKSATSDCSLKGRTVKAAVSGTCELTITITKKGVIMGSQKLTLNRA